MAKGENGSWPCFQSPIAILLVGDSVVHNKPLRRLAVPYYYWTPVSYLVFYDDDQTTWRNKPKKW